MFDTTGMVPVNVNFVVDPTLYTEEDLKPKTEGSAGIDLKACISEEDDRVIVITDFISSILIDTGLRMSIPKGYVGKVYIRSGISKHYMLANGTGIIDSDYRGIIKLRLVPYSFPPNSNGERTLTIQHGDRIGQLIIEKLPTNLKYNIVDKLDETERGEGGFGHTGK